MHLIIFCFHGRLINFSNIALKNKSSLHSLSTSMGTHLHLLIYHIKHHNEKKV